MKVVFFYLIRFHRLRNNWCSVKNTTLVSEELVEAQDTGILITIKSLATALSLTLSYHGDISVNTNHVD